MTDAFQAKDPQEKPGRESDKPRKRSRVVIVGGGFGGLIAARRLKRAPVDVVIVDRRNHHLFQPLLYQVATAFLSPANIAVPIRAIFRRYSNVTVLLAKVDAVQADKKRLVLDDGFLEYDHLILAAGARHSYFGNDDWEKDAPGLKSLEDAVRIRRRVLSAFEMAEKTKDPAEREALMTFVIIGAGPTGVEMAGAIAETARYTLDRDFRNIVPREARVIVAEGGPRALPTFHPSLSEYAQRTLRKLGVEVRLNTFATDVGPHRVCFKDEEVPARTIFWAAGNTASPLGRTLGTELDRANRVVVDHSLHVPDHPEIQVIGDMAHFKQPDGTPLPGVSPVAIQQGKHAARNIRRKLAGKPPLSFRYFNKGTMATIGRNAAVADIRGLRLTGFIAWLAWVFLHIMYLVGFRNRLVTFFEWTYAYFSFSKGARLITWDLAEEVAMGPRKSVTPNDSPKAQGAPRE